MINTVEICKKVLKRLSEMDYEKGDGSSSEQLIFPMKIQAKGTKEKDRISEQELRQLFIEEFKKANSGLFYSIETPTEIKYKFGNTFDEIQFNENGQSALLDMCVFDRIQNNYVRTQNIEFKHKNSPLESIGKDILKLIAESQNGSFIQLLDSTDNGTFCNEKVTGVFNKFYKSFTQFQSNWSNNEKSILIIILSLKQKTIIYREIKKQDFNNLKDIFYFDKSCGNINEIKDFGWENYILK